MNTNILIDIVGWIGVAELLIAYVLVSIRKLEGDSVLYQLLNMMGGAFLIANSFYYRAYPSVGVNVAWIGIAIYTLTRTRLRLGKNRS